MVHDIVLAVDGSETLTMPGPGLGRVHSVLLFPGVDETGADFGLFENVNIWGSVFDDLNGNEAYDMEPGVVNRVVFLDANGNGVLDGKERSTRTDGSGGFLFEDVGPGFFTVRQQTPDGVVEQNVHQVAVTSGTDVGDVQLGSFILGRIRGRVLWFPRPGLA